MRFRHSLTMLLAVLLLLGTVRTDYAVSVHTGNASQAALTQEDILSILTGSETYAEDETIELCLTLDTPGAADRIEQGTDEAEAVQAVAYEQQALLEKLHASFEGSELVASNGYLVNTLTVRVPAHAAAAADGLPGVANAARAGWYTLPVLPASEEAAAGSTMQPLAQSQAGQGQVIAVIDTGIDLSHEAMALDDPSAVKLTREQAGALIESIGYGQYHSDKIPFYYNYADGSTAMLDQTNQQHGMHVAGICAGNSDTLQGIAPQAQILAMRVFGEGSQAAPDYAVVAAVEDAVRLGADVINLSLGSSFGFSSLGSEAYQEAVAAARERGILVVAAAGNDGRSDVVQANGRAAYVLGESLYDNATVSAPACYDGFVSVAAAKSAQELASFSSFGPAPDLSFSPFVTALGVNIASSLNANEYGSKSGTSMAAPAVSGAFAVLAQSLADRGMLPEGAQRADLLSAILMNTAQPIALGSRTISIRGQGAGLIDLDAATAATVTAVASDGRPVIELGHLYPDEQPTVEIALTLHNLGTQRVEYRVVSQPVLTEDTATTSLYCHSLDGALMEVSDALVSLDAGESKTVFFTLHLPATAKGYIEGYLYLTGDSAPDLSVPYLGFAGEWEDPMVITEGEYAPILASPTLEGDSIVYQPATVLSPNGDGYGDMAVPLFYQLRNALQTKYSLYDANGNLVAECARYQGVPKDSYTVLRSGGLTAKALEGSGMLYLFTGYLFDPATNTYRPLDDGRYTIQITLTAEDGVSESIQLPVQIDTTPPVLLSSYGNADQAVILWSEALRADGAAVVYDPETGEAADDAQAYLDADGALHILPGRHRRLGLAVADEGLNLAYYTLEFTQDGVYAAASDPLPSRRTLDPSAAGGAADGFTWVTPPPETICLDTPGYNPETGCITLTARCPSPLSTFAMPVAGNPCFGRLTHRTPPCSPYSWKWKRAITPSPW